MPIDDAYYSVSSVSPSSWNVLATIISRQSVEWKIEEQQVTSQISVAWDTDFRVKVNNMGSVPGLSSPVVHPIDWHYIPAGSTWNIEARCSSNVKISWNISKRISSKKASSFNVLDKVHNFATFKWNILQRIYVPGFTSIQFYNGISQPVVHPVDMQNEVVSPAITWNVSQRRNTDEKIRYNILQSRRSQSRSLWNTLCTSVQSQIAATWNLHKAIIRQATVKWNVIGRTYSRIRSLWNDRATVASQKSIAFNTLNFVRIIKVLTANYGLIMPVVHPIDEYKTVNTEIQWNINERTFSDIRVEWKNTVHVISHIPITWNTLMRIEIPDYYSIYYPGVSQAAVHPITFRTYPWGPRIAWNLGVESVISQVQVTWHDLDSIETRKAVAWSTVGRTGSAIALKWNTLSSVISRDTIEWNVGQVIPAFIRQTSVSRQDFAY
jgi:hypothetical protein